MIKEEEEELSKPVVKRRSVSTSSGNKWVLGGREVTLRFCGQVESPPRPNYFYQDHQAAGDGGESDLAGPGAVWTGQGQQEGQCWAGEGGEGEENDGTAERKSSP